MAEPLDPTDLSTVFPGWTEMALRCRAFDWTATPLGPVAAWPQSLRTAIALCLDAAVPSYVWCGPELIQVYNDAARAVVRAKHPAALGRPAREVWADVWPVVGPLLERVLATGEAVHGDDMLMVPERDGPGAAPEPAWFTFSYSAARDECGAVAGVFCTVLETTARVHAEAALRASEEALRARLVELEAARAEAEAANRAKAEFLAVMSHELRTPLNAIGGYAELMALGIRGPVTPAQRDDLARIQRSERHLLGLVNEVLNYARLETGTVHYELTAVRLRDALAGAEALVAPQAQGKGLTLTVRDCPLDLAVRADPEKLRQILVNLMSNAVKFTDRGGRVDLACAEAKGEARVTVRDTGIGIAADQTACIFEPFVQVRTDLTRPHEGTGLGLAISRDLARGMGGDLTVESTPCVGSTFTLTLPSPDRH